MLISWEIFLSCESKMHPWVPKSVGRQWTLPCKKFSFGQLATCFHQLIFKSVVIQLTICLVVGITKSIMVIAVCAGCGRSILCYDQG